MKKIFFVALMMVAAGGMTYAQTTSQKKAAKPVSTVSSVTPAKNSVSPNTVTTAKTKPAAAPAVSNKPVTTTGAGKHKKRKPAAKK